MSADYWVTIGDIAEVYDGPHATPKKTEVGPYFLSISSLERGALDLSKSAHVSEEDFVKWTKRVTPQAGDLLFSYETRLGDAALMPANITACLGRRMGLLRPKADKVVSEYLLYAYLSPSFQETIRSKTIHGATVDRIALKELPTFSIRIPSKREQQEVVEILSTLDQKILVNRQTNQTLEEMARAMFKSWFVDFEPTRAKIAAKENGEDPERAAMATIAGKTIAQLNTLPPEQLKTLKSTASLFPDALIDSELGEIPEGWEVKPLSSWGDIVCGKTPPKKNKEYYGGNIPFIKIPDMHGNMYAIKTTDSLTMEGANTQKKKIIPKGSVCVSCIATVGQVLIACENSATNQQINSIVPNSEIYTPYLYFSMLGSYDHLHDLASGGSATLNLNTRNFSKIDIAKPDDSILQRFNDLLAPTMANILSNCYQNQTLENLRDTLLPKLLSGEIDLSKVGSND
ncbi:MAG: hypothetical protein CBB87_05090 [Micavibrio sp. TMED27]|nr:restriction endonuclease subunit S [Micavibrio sp.]OUT91404.1 MAG: hypothetical protein CBB87_05090 [Micavibrio sp. TMED27]|tara:strand:- start:4993 stop:6366 length:1374 start_codon:yes stop_codon:yes gene_type:complete